MKNNDRIAENADTLPLSKVIKVTVALFFAYGLLYYIALVINAMYASGKSVLFIPNFLSPLMCLSAIVISAVYWVRFIWKRNASLLQWGASVAVFTAVFAVLCYNIFIPMLLIGSQSLIAEVTAHRIVYHLQHGERDKLDVVYLKNDSKNADYYNGLNLCENIEVLLDDFSQGITKDSFKSFRCFQSNGGGFGGGRGAITEYDYSGTFYKPVVTSSGKQYKLSFRIVLFDRDGSRESGLQYAVFTPFGN